MPIGILAAVRRTLIPLITDVATDPRKLKPGELCRLLNSTPVGEALTDRRLRAQRTKAGLRIGDGQTIDLFRYAAWLMDEVTPPPAPPPSAASTTAPVPVGGSEPSRWRIYEAIPQKDWIEMSGRQAKVINEQASRYGLPFGGAVINLPLLARSLHDFLAIHARRLAKYVGTQPDEEEEGDDNLELYRGERYLRERLKRMAEEQSLLPRAEVHEKFTAIAAILRNAGDMLQRQFGVEAHEILDKAITECEQKLETLTSDGSQQPDA